MSEGTTKWEATKQWVKQPTVTRGSSAVLVAAFIASADTIITIINDGIAGRPLSHWHFIKVLFSMALAGAHNYSTYTDDTHARSKMNGTEFSTRTAGKDPEGHLK